MSLIRNNFAPTHPCSYYPVSRGFLVALCSGRRISNLRGKPSDSLTCRIPGFWTNRDPRQATKKTQLAGYISIPAHKHLGHTTPPRESLSASPALSTRGDCCSDLKYVPATESVEETCCRGSVISLKLVDLLHIVFI